MRNTQTTQQQQFTEALECLSLAITDFNGVGSYLNGLESLNTNLDTPLPINRELYMRVTSAKVSHFAEKVAKLSKELA